MQIRHLQRLRQQYNVRLTIHNGSSGPITTDKQFKVVFGDGTFAAANAAALPAGQDISVVCPQKSGQSAKVKTWGVHWHSDKK